MDDHQHDPTGYVVVVAKHPVLGRVFWTYVNESNVNAPDYYGLTLHLEHASWIPAGWRQDQNLSGKCGVRDLHAWQAQGFLESVLDEKRLGSEYRISFSAAHLVELHLSGSLGRLRLQSGQTTKGFIRWIRTTEWSDEPAKSSETESFFAAKKSRRS
ncbi:hypothetical protein [Pseudomonas sp.]|uniref:hypothetical protein n=1 Tax=Pseudomonas sp. TaxID=306 RepID=UPI002625E0FE|nr:hypothetical protein [Pseudomonas sp.]